MSLLIANKYLSLINKHGRNCTITTKAYGAYDPATGTATSTTPTPVTVKGYFAEYDISEIDNDIIIKGDRKVSLPYSDTSGNTLLEPKVGDIITNQGDPVRVMMVTKIMDGESVACYICRVRK